MSAPTFRSLGRSLARSSFRPAASSYHSQPVAAGPILSSPCALPSYHTSSSSRSQPIRTFFSLPDISKLAGLSAEAGANDGSGVETDGDEQRYHARKILPYTQSQLYALVSDVPSYSSFIPFCNSSEVLTPSSSSSSTTTTTSRVVETSWKPGDEAFDVEAELRVGFGGLEERFISRVVGRPFDSVTATASQQTPLFKSLVTTWSFSPASPLSPHPTNTSPPTTTTSSTHRSICTPQTDHEEGPTLLTVDLAFAFVNPLHRIASQAVLPKVADKMVEAFEKRCLDVWGRGKE